MSGSSETTVKNVISTRAAEDLQVARGLNVRAYDAQIVQRRRYAADKATTTEISRYYLIRYTLETIER